MTGFGALVTTSYVNEQAYREASSGSERWQDQWRPGAYGPVLT